MTFLLSWWFTDFVYITFTFRAYSRNFYPKQLTISTFHRRKRNNIMLLSVSIKLHWELHCSNLMSKCCYFISNSSCPFAYNTNICIFWILTTLYCIWMHNYSLNAWTSDTTKSHLSAMIFSELLLIFLTVHHSFT